MLTLVAVLAGQPAFTATVLAAVCATTSALVSPATVVVVTVAFLGGPLLEKRKTAPMTTPATTTMMPPLRTCWRRFLFLASAARRASRAARCRALLSLGTARDPIGPRWGGRIGAGTGRSSGGGSAH